MAAFIDRFAVSLRKHADYRRTVAAIRSLPLDTALDLDIYPGDAESIAARAVYSR